MNKKLLFGIMSLAALAACTNDDFENQGAVAEQTSPIQFEVINGDASMRASMSTTDKIVWSAEDGDLFTLYHGAATLGDVTGYQNATYKAEASDGGTARLTTPSMINAGGAVMVWPVDTAFRYRADGNTLKISIPNNQKADVENYIPYMSDLINIGAYDGVKAPDNTEGFGRTYPVYMRPMASQLILHADYAGTDATLKTLEEGEDGIDPIELTSVALQADGSTVKFNIKVPVKFSDPVAATSKWSTVTGHAWTKVTDFDLTSGVVSVPQLTTECITGTESAKFLVLPQDNINTATSGAGVTDAAVVFNTTYGKVVVAPTDNTTNIGLYTTGAGGEIADAWYRYTKASDAAESYETKATSETAGKGYKTTTNLKQGLMQVIDVLSAYKTGKTSSPVYQEPTGAAADRYVKVLLSHLDMSELHIKTDKQLRDVVRVWEKMNLPSVIVYLDGDDPTDAAGKFTISQKTIKKINEINAAVASAGRAFTVMPCQTAKEICKEIVITGADTDANIQDIAFIKKNGVATAKVVLANETTAWKWNGTGTTTATKKVLVGEGVERIINKGTMLNDASATLATWSVNYASGTNVMTVGAQSVIKLQNDGTWNITAGTLRVQSDVVNYGTVNIAAGAEYLQDGNPYLFTNQAKTLPKRITKADTETIGLVNNSGVFATLNDGRIHNYGLIEHLTKSAKTYITRNEIGGTDFSTPFAFNSKAMGRINLKYENKDEDNISISAAAAQGFVSITITEEDDEDDLKTSLVENSFVNYIIVNGGVEQISALPTKIKYVEINQPGTEMVWNLSAAATYEGLIVLSPVNVKLGQTITINKATYIGAKMYVGGTFTKGSWSGYYGDTTDNSTTMYITY